MVETVEKSIVVLGYIMMSFSIYISSYFKRMDFKISKNNIRRESRENRIFSDLYNYTES